MGEQFAGTSKITISGEQNFTFGGTSYDNGRANLIHDNGRGGIVTEEAVTMDIIKNDIYDNQWGGISTDKIDPTAGYPNYVGFTGTLGSAVLNIRKNYIHGNGKASDGKGGGIVYDSQINTVNDQVVLSVENWLKLVSPADGSEFQLSEGSVFVWDSSYTKFKVQFGKVEGQFTHTFPKHNDVWLNEPSFTLDKEQTADIKDLLERSQILYWRVLGYDGTGNVEISKAQHIVVPK